jgi:BirA family transcriptional regulator, biotin operon repressor / biotin---[acetyl-CoA-carboxylase] ligase
MPLAGPYQDVARELAGTAFSAIRYVNVTESTNADASSLLGEQRFAGLSIVAEYQTRGAGRKGRTWSAAPGSSLLFTTILPSPIPSRDLWVVPFWSALAVADALAECGADATLVWPNDLLLPSGKVAGVLCASRVAGDTAWAACGVGVNVHRNADAEDGSEPVPGFCDDVAPVERPALLRAILLRYEATCKALHNPQRIARLWEKRAGLPGSHYRILKDGECAPFEATALSLATGGGLVVERATGSRETIALADARVLR